MKYKNIVFDYGNVVGRFNGSYILDQFCSSEEDRDMLASIVYSGWAELDRGTTDYDEYAEAAVARVPERLKEVTRTFFREWPRHVIPLEDTIRFIRELKSGGTPVYLLSNAPTCFAEWAKAEGMTDMFDGVVFSAPIKMAKPDPDIYRYLFEKYTLKPEECFFIDDLKENIEAGRALGMDGIVFAGDIDAVKAAVGF